MPASIHPVSRRALLIAAGVITALTVTGCTTAADSLAEQYRAGDGKNYIAGDGTISEFRSEDRTPPIEFSGEVESGETVASTDLIGEVVVVNFWYAGCAPCRAEAPDLQAMWEKYQGQGVRFLGVNVRDQLGTAEAFSSSFGITYPSVLDVNDGAVQLAFSGTVAPNAVPTTLVMDKQGRIAARILGRLQDASILDTLIASALAEKP